MQLQLTEEQKKDIYHNNDLKILLQDECLQNNIKSLLNITNSSEREVFLAQLQTSYSFREFRKELEQLKAKQSKLQ